MKQQGFSLIELMVSVAILSIVAAVAVPMYSSYVDSGRDGALTWNIATLEIFQEDLRLNTGAYAGGTYDVGGGDTSLTTNTGWEPQADDGTVYVVVANGGVSYTVTGTDATGAMRCMLFPAKTACP